MPKKIKNKTNVEIPYDLISLRTKQGEEGTVYEATWAVKSPDPTLSNPDADAKTTDGSTPGLEGPKVEGADAGEEETKSEDSKGNDDPVELDAEGNPKSGTPATTPSNMDQPKQEGEKGDETTNGTEVNKLTRSKGGLPASEIAIFARICNSIGVNTKATKENAEEFDEATRRKYNKKVVEMKDAARDAYMVYEEQCIKEKQKIVKPLLYFMDQQLAKYGMPPESKARRAFILKLADVAEREKEAAKEFTKAMDTSVTFYHAYLELQELKNREEAASKKRKQQTSGASSSADNPEVNPKKTHSRAKLAKAEAVKPKRGANNLDGVKRQVFEGSSDDSELSDDNDDAMGDTASEGVSEDGDKEGSNTLRNNSNKNSGSERERDPNSKTNKSASSRSKDSKPPPKTPDGKSQGLGSPPPKKFEADSDANPGIPSQTVGTVLLTNDTSIALKDLNKSSVDVFVEKLKGMHAAGRTFTSYRALIVETAYNQLPYIFDKELTEEGVSIETPIAEQFRIIESWSIEKFCIALTANARGKDDSANDSYTKLIKFIREYDFIVMEPLSTSDGLGKMMSAMSKSQTSVIRDPNELEDAKKMGEVWTAFLKAFERCPRTWAKTAAVELKAKVDDKLKHILT